MGNGPSGCVGKMLSMLTTDQKGAIAEQAIALEAMRNGLACFGRSATSDTT
jgi:hypothetical protein